MEQPEEVTEFIPRDYQVQLMDIATKQNTIVYLPTGSGKTYIALMVLKRFSNDLNKNYKEGGKISFILVNTVALVEQHTKYVADHTVLRVRGFSGEMNLDGWRLDQWEEQFQKYQVLVMTSQILNNIMNNNFIDYKRVNLIIFDECHRGVDDHSMRQIMKKLPSSPNSPHILGLTATLLNGNCKLCRVIESVLSLESTFRSKVATVDGLEKILGYSTNPHEDFKISSTSNLPNMGQDAMALLDKSYNVLQKIKSGHEFYNMPIASDVLKPLEPQDALKTLKNLIVDLQFHIEKLGIFGGYKACIAYMIHIERIKKHCSDLKVLSILNSVLTSIGICSAMFANFMLPYPDKIHRFSSNKVQQLFEILRDFKMNSKEPLCCLIFVQRRFTAKILHHVLESLRQTEPEFSYIKSNFMVGTNNNPFNQTREPLYISKKNREVLSAFADKEFNILVCSNVLEEGVDIPKCTLVVKFDKALDYRSYIQSKGRARHPKSYYYNVVEAEEQQKFVGRYVEFQQIEKLLSDYLVGKNELRNSPSSPNSSLDDDLIPPYFVNGPDSAQVNMTSAISLLCRYCASLPADKYTVYAPDWYLEQSNSLGQRGKIRVVITLPIICPIVEPIVGPWAVNKKDAKRAAALVACIALHKIGELDDDLLPLKKEINEEDVEYLFRSWPVKRDKKDGNKKMKRLHETIIPEWISKDISSNSPCHLHIININPKYQAGSELNDTILCDMYVSDLRFGLLTCEPLPPFCHFPLYDSGGELEITITRNVKTVHLSEAQLNDLKQFHYLVFNDILEVLKEFLLYGSTGRGDMLLLVPVKNNEIQFEIAADHKTVPNRLAQPTMTDRCALQVDEDSFLHKIVSPWYRNQPKMYFVSRVFIDKSPMSRFPNEEFKDFASYYDEKHNLRISNRNQPLLLVKALSQKTNTFKPRGGQGDRKRKRNSRFEENEEYLIPELVVKQDFPSSLWIQSRFLPCILSRLTFLLRLRQLQETIGKELNLRVDNRCRSLELDIHLLHYEPRIKEISPAKIEIDPIPVDSVDNGAMISKQYNKDFVTKRLESEYSWKNIDEPKDIERNLDVTILEIEHYERFIGHNVANENRLLHASPKRTLPAITYEKEFKHKPIKIFSIDFHGQMPDLAEFYQAMSTAEANDIVNLERMETLGDSLLKYLSSVYLTFKYPHYNEGKLTTLKGRIVSNRNLYYLANAKNFGGILKNSDLSAKDEWVPPCFAIPDAIAKAIDDKQMSVTALFDCVLSQEEAISGSANPETLEDIVSSKYPITDDEQNSYHNMCHFIRKQYVGDKSVADSVEAILGAFLLQGGIGGGIKFMEWMGIIPESEHVENLIRDCKPNPVINDKATPENVDFHLPQYEFLEERLGYKFKNRAFLLQALTHSSYSPNRITYCYERLEFLGDAILDFVLTCYIYEHCGYLTPGQVTDLRSALVNNNTFASLAVRCGIHKFLLIINADLQGYIDRFADYLEAKNYVIDDEVLILLEEDDLNMAEYVDVPKILGDVFEAFIGAVYLDSSKDLEQVWKVIYKIMWNEIDLFSSNVPINVIRRLFEAHTAYPMFSKSVELDNKKTMVCLEFMCEGRKKRVYGFGSNKVMAKKAAAKIALRSLKL